MNFEEETPTMKNCPSCANPVSADATFCPTCGRDLTVASAAPGPGPTPAQPVEAKTSGLAVASLILSLFSLLVIPAVPAILLGHVSLLSFFSLLVIPAVLAIVLGHVSRGKIKRAAGKLKGGGVARVGLVFGYLCVAVALFIVVIVIPNLLDRHSIPGTQASAVGSLRTINTAEITYAATYNTGYSTSLRDLAPPDSGEPSASAAGLIDSVLASGTKAGYAFRYTPGPRVAEGRIDTYTLTGQPIEGCGTGKGNCYFTDNTGVIRQNSTAPATQADSPVAG